MRSFLILAITLTTLCSSAYCQTKPINCLTDIEGKYIQWDSKWQKDAKENNLVYKIVRKTKVPSKLHYVLELKPMSAMKKKYRNLSITNKSSFPNFCERISTDKNVNFKSDSTIEIEENLTFIEFKVVDGSKQHTLKKKI